MNGFDISTATGIYLGNTLVDSLYIGSTKVWPLYDSEYLTFEVVEAGTVTVTALGGPLPTMFEPKRTIQYSTDDGQNWSSLTTSTTEQTLGTLAVGDKILLKGTNTNYATSITQYNVFGGTAKVNVYGNIMSLLYGDNFVGQTSLTDSYTFFKLFAGLNVVSAKNLVLPATTLTTNCYGQMFNGCTLLTDTPRLPATTLAANCYQYMFGGCSSLTKDLNFQLLR